jgi:nitrate/nitrite transporter NarK
MGYSVVWLDSISSSGNVIVVVIAVVVLVVLVAVVFVVVVVEIIFVVILVVTSGYVMLVNTNTSCKQTPASLVQITHQLLLNTWNLFAIL